MRKSVFSRTLAIYATTAFASGVVFSASAADQDITAIFGSGNGDTNWTTGDGANGIELGLRAKQRFPAANIFNSGGDGTYSFATGNGTGGPGTPGGSRPLWNFEWSINSGSVSLNSLTYLLEIDSNPGFGATFSSAFDPINQTFADHSIGTDGTLNGQGTEATTNTEYADLIANNNIAQNSWTPHWFVPFDPNVDGQYTFVLTALSGGTEVASTSIDVIVGNGAVIPTPSAALAGLFMFGGLAARRRRRRAG